MCLDASLGYDCQQEEMGQKELRKCRSLHGFQGPANAGKSSFMACHKDHLDPNSTGKLAGSFLPCNIHRSVLYAIDSSDCVSCCR